MNLDDYEKLLPQITEANRPFWEGCLAGELRLQVCESCGQRRLPDSPVCPRCLSRDFEWRAQSGRGRVWSWIVMHQRYLEAFADELPYVVLLVELDEGPWMISALDGDQRRLRIDAPLEVTFSRIDHDRAIPKFRVSG
ncbi:MAG: Zn-ribbon domain-containing OB-fold protein [Solirubrobacteraceae bacterium]